MMLRTPTVHLPINHTLQHGLLGPLVRSLPLMQSHEPVRAGACVHSYWTMQAMMLSQQHNMFTLTEMDVTQHVLQLRSRVSMATCL